MEALALLAIGSLALWMGVAIVGAQLLRRRRRQDMGLPPLSRHSDGTDELLPRRETDWRDHAPAWSRPNYYGSTRRRP